MYRVEVSYWYLENVFLTMCVWCSSLQQVVQLVAALLCPKAASVGHPCRVPGAGVLGAVPCGGMDCDRRGLLRHGYADNGEEEARRSKFLRCDVYMDCCMSPMYHPRALARGLCTILFQRGTPLRITAVMPPV